MWNMSVTNDIKYINLISYRLPLFKIKKQSPFQANFRCVFCGDSKTNQYKTRGYLIENKDHIVYKCQNCQKATNVEKLVQHLDFMLHQQYLIDDFQERAAIEQPAFVTDPAKNGKKRFQKYDGLKNAIPISKLNHRHPAKLYVESRKIPSKFHYKLFYVPKFYEWVNTLLPEKFDEKALAKDEPRLIIPFIDRNGYVFGFQGRSFRPKTSLRYISIMLDDEKQKVYGLDEIDPTKTVYVMEGPIDSMFIPNSLAMAGADIDINKLHKLGIDVDKLVFVYDNEPRNKEILDKVQSVINAGYKVCIWPTSPLVKEDINEMILRGVKASEIEAILKENTYSDLTAMLKFADWVKYKEKEKKKNVH
jgi:transcription elongation factor Elf1